MTEELGSIGVKLRVDLSDLDRAEQRVKKTVGQIAREHTISFKVGNVNVTEVQRQIASITRGKVDIKVGVSLPSNAGRLLKSQLQTQLKAAGPVKVAVTAELSSTEIARIKGAIGKAGVRVGAVGGGVSGAAVTGPVTPHERRVNEDVATKVGAKVERALKTGSGGGGVPPPSVAAPRQGTARSAPKPPSIASQASASAATPGRPITRPLGDFGSLPTGPAVGVSYAPDPKTGQRKVVPEPTKGVGKRLSKAGQRASSQGVSMNTLKRDKARAAQVAPEDEEYASRPSQVRVPMTNDEQEFAERNLHGVRGAGRSGARQYKEPVLTAAERQAIGDKQDIMADEASAEANARVRAPARRSKAYYGTPKSPRFDRMKAGLQFAAFDPALRLAQSKLDAGDLDGARAALRGFSGQLAGADPRKRKKFFRLFRNVENAPPEVLEKHAALQGLFAEIGNQEATKRLTATEATLAPYRAGKAGKALREQAPDAYADAMEAVKAARKFQMDMLRGLRPRAAGGPVRGMGGIDGEQADYEARWATAAPAKPQYQADMPGDARARLTELNGLMADAAAASRKESLDRMLSGHEQPYGPDQKRYAEMLHEQAAIHNKWKTRAGGGPVTGGLAARIAAAQLKKDAYLVGETKPELFRGHSGKFEIVGENGPEVRTFDEPGKIEPHVPEWLRRGSAKDLTGRAAGGPVRGVGNRQFRSFVPGEKEAITGGLLGRGDSGSVQRVFVVNFPAGSGITGAPRGGSVAAGPLRFGTDKDANAFADRLGGSIGSQLKDILGATREVKPKAPTDETVRPAALSPEEKVGSRISAIGEGSPREIRGVLTGIKSALSETQSQSPVRSLAPAFGQIVATRLGRGELLKRLAVARDLTSQAARAEGIWTAELTKEENIRKQLDKTDDPKARQQLVADLEAQSKATQSAALFTRKLVGEAEGAAKAADSMGLKLGVLLGNTLGIVGGTLAFGATLAVAQAGISAITTVLSPAIERMSGFTNVSAKTTSQLADQTKALGGASDAAFAMAASQSGIGKATADAIGPLLKQRAEVEAGNKTIQQGLELLHTFEEAKRRGGQQGLSTTTGGFFGTLLGGTASTQEIIKGELNSPDARLGSNDPNAPAAIAALKAKRLELEKNPGYRNNQGLAVIDAQLKQLQGTGVDSLTDRLAFFNDGLKRGGSNLKFMAGASADVAAAFARTADRAGFTEIGDTARGVNKVILVNPNGTPVTNGDQIKAALEAINQSQQAPDPAVLIKQLTERVIPAQRAQFRAQSNFQRNATLPAQFALGEIAAPTPGLNTSPLKFEAGLVGKGDKQAAKVASAIKKDIGGAIDFVNNEITKGRDALVNLVPADLRGEFTGLLDDIAATGQQMSAISAGISQQQVNLEVKDYNNQLRIANRSLQDAKDLQAGIAGATKQTVGGLEGQNIALQRQLQLLGFQLQQRQINFSVATAGFVAPGTTPEERAARIEAAKQEAAFAQKQLDIQKQLANNQFKGVQISVSRDVTDLVAQIGLLQQGRDLTINTAAASKALDILNKKQKILVEQAGTYIEEGVKITQAAIEAAGEVQKQTGKSFQYLLSETAKAWGIFGQQAQIVLNALRGSAPKPSPSGGQSGLTGERGYANGIVGDTLGPTQLTVGEAAGEKVAVLRNPKLVPSSSLYGAAAGGTSAGPLIQMNIVISGNTVREESDLEALAERMAQKVEDRLMQKTSLFGLRRA